METGISRRLCVDCGKLNNMKILINVTRDDISYGIKNDMQLCPVGLAMSRELKRSVIITFDYWRYTTCKGNKCHNKLPESVRKCIYDQSLFNIELEPFIFELNISFMEYIALFFRKIFNTYEKNNN